MEKTFSVNSKHASIRLVPSPRIALFLTIAVLIGSACANSAGCAPASLVSSALAKTKEIVSEELGSVKAEILLYILKRRAVIVEGEVCFLQKDFAEFGRLVAQFLDLHLSHTDRNQLHDDAPSFAQAVETVGDSTRKCLCLRCPSGRRSWCSPSRSQPECCPHICTEIFSTISVGALTGLRGSGVDACCEDSAKDCPLPPTNRKPSRQRHSSPAGSPVPTRLPPSSPTSSTDVPEFQFGVSSAREPSSVSASPSPVMARSSFFRMGLKPPPPLPSFEPTESSESEEMEDRPDAVPQPRPSTPEGRSSAASDERTLESLVNSEESPEPSSSAFDLDTIAGNFAADVFENQQDMQDEVFI